jgi:HSP20 family protein
MDRLFDELWHGFDLAPWSREGGTFTPRIDVEETDTELVMSAELPGLETKDFDIELHEDLLTIKGEKRVETQDKSRGYTERSSGSFRRTFRLSCEVDADKVSAEYKNGILKVTLPKPSEAASQSRRIEVKTG